MQILPINSQNNNNQNFQAVSQKYLKIAEKEFCRKGGTIGNVLDCLTADVYFKQIPVQDAIDTIESIKQLAGKTNSYMEHVLEYFKKCKELSNQ